MTQIYNASAPLIKKLLASKKFRIEDSLTAELVKYLTTKVFYTLSAAKLLDRFEGAIQLGEELTVYPYRSILNDVRFLIKYESLLDGKVVIQWNGKFGGKNEVHHNDFFVNQKDFNVTTDLDSFVQFEQRIVKILNDVENGLFSALPLEAETLAS